MVLIGTSCTSPESMNYVSVVFNSGWLLSVCRQQPKLFAALCEAPLANNSIGYNTILVLGTSFGNKMWSNGLLSLSLEISSGLPLYILGSFYYTSFPCPHSILPASFHIPFLNPMFNLHFPDG